MELLLVIYLQAMKTKIIYFFLLLSISYYHDTYSQSITVNDQLTAQQLVENVLVNSSCASVRNFSIKGGNFGNGEQSYGYFTNTSPLFSLQDGIILSTGKAKTAGAINNAILVGSEHKPRTGRTGPGYLPNHGWTVAGRESSGTDFQFAE